MKIKIIGSGSMWTEYNSASYLIDEDILVDIPNGMCKNLFKFKINPRGIKHVLITHFHGDHYFDIPFFFLLKSKAPLKDINIYCSKDGKGKCQKLLKLAFPNSTKRVFKEIKLNYIYAESFNINDYLVKKYLVLHGKMKPAFGYVFEGKNFKVGFTGDTSLCENVEYMAGICTYLFCDCMLIEGNSKHMGINNIEYLSRKYPHCIFILSHLDNETRNILKRKKYSNIIVPQDGDVIELKEV